jgi:VanZ family protein
LFKFLELHKKYFVYLPLLFYWLLILTLTSLPGNDMPDVKISDKIEHLLAFGGLGFLLHLSLRIQDKFSTIKKMPWLFSILFVALYAAFDELHQLFIPGRSCDINDWIADMIGVTIGVGIMALLMVVFDKKKPDQIKNNEKV